VQVFLYIAYLIIGFVQLFAIAAGIQYGTEFPMWMSYIIALFTTYIPFIGSLLGVYGALNAWDWSLIQALALFFWYVPVYAVVFLYSIAFAR
jgi:hypothetical protein